MNKDLYESTYHENIALTQDLKGATKSPIVGVILALFLGGTGAHRFYLEDYLVGGIFLALSGVLWFLVDMPYLIAIINIIEVGFMPTRVKAWNKELTLSITKKMAHPHVNPFQTLSANNSIYKRWYQPEHL